MCGAWTSFFDVEGSACYRSISTSTIEPVIAAVGVESGSQTGHRTQFAAAEEHLVVAGWFQRLGFQFGRSGQAAAILKH